MASKLLVGVAVVVGLVVIAGILLLTVVRDEANRAAADWLVRQATTDEEYALVFVSPKLDEAGNERPTFVCASKEAGPAVSWDANALASAAGMAAGTWVVDEAGEFEDGVQYAIVVDVAGELAPRKDFDFHDVTLAGRTLTCAVPLQG
jgi:hypothetical protein